LGDCILQLVDTPTGTTFADYAFLLLQFAIVFNIGDIYYQQQVVGRHLFHVSKRNTPSYLWAILHTFLSLSILYFGGALKRLNMDDTQHDPHSAYTQLIPHVNPLGLQSSLSLSNPSYDSFFIPSSSSSSFSTTMEHTHTSRPIADEHYVCWCVCVSLFLIYALRIQHKGLWDEGKLQMRKFSYIFRLISCAVCGAIPYFTHSEIHTIIVLFAITGVLVLQVDII
jgi:hypothetical protein